MKKIVLLVILAFGVINFGCEEDDEYYVKYEVDSFTIYSGGKLDVTINTENNTNTTVTINTRTPLETVIGPVQKGFNASLKVESQETDNHLALDASISVSKNDSPFALKESDGSVFHRYSVQINYTIDF